MARIILITGGCRSGKSSFAQNLAESVPGRRVFIATCQPVDEEMRERIRKHRQARAGAGWETVQEPLDLSGAVSQARSYEVVLVDCVTVWVSNLMHEASQAGAAAKEEDLLDRCQGVISACRAHGGTVILVTNEVGMSVVPVNAVARLFRDVVGRCNQALAAAADQVTLMSCGIPVSLKGLDKT